jgi:hypothetical protein
MEDHISTKTIEQLLTLQSQMDKEYARNEIFGDHDITLDEESMPWILNHMKCFVRQSRRDKRVKEVYFYPYSVGNQDDEVWDKVGEAIGNLQALERLGISTLNLNINYHDNDDDDDGKDQVVPKLDWKMLARILSHVRQNVHVELHDSDRWDAEEVQALARAIRGHPTISGLILAITTSPMKLWMCYIQRWQLCQLWNRSDFLIIRNRHG